MKSMLAMIDLLTPKWLLLAVVTGFALHSCGQGREIQALRVKVATAETGEAQAKGQLAQRIAAEATAVAQAVQKARAEEQAKQAAQQGKIDELRRQNAAATGELAAARERVRNTIYGLVTTGAGGANVPPGTGLARRTLDPEGAEFQGASGGFADRLLQLNAEADEVVRERNTCADLRRPRS